MPQGTILTETRYAKLVRDIRTLINEGRSRAQQAVNQELVRTYWAIGKRLTEEELTGRAHYGESVLEDLSDELGVDARTLRHSILFFQTYKLSPRAQNLAWSHYRELIRIKDDQVRRFYERETQRLGWTRDQLMRAIQSEAYEQANQNGSNKLVKKLTRPTAASYVYKAEVERVVDGDTVILRIDLGFQVWKKQRIRFAEIDTPPLDEARGKEAYRFVREKLAQAETVAVKTNKIDIYGRYVGHIFYTNKKANLATVFEKGHYLNQQLLDKRLAISL